MNGINDPFEQLSDDTACRINAEIMRLEMMCTAIDWLEGITKDVDGKATLKTLRGWLFESMREARDDFENNTPITKANGDRIKQPNENESQRFRSYAFRLVHIYGGYWDAINKTVEAIASNDKNKLDEAVEGLRDYLNKKRETERKRREAGKRAYNETRKERDDRAKKEYAKAFKMCERTFETTSFAKKDAVFEHVITELNLNLTPGTLRNYYYTELRKRKQNKKGTPSCK